MLVITTTPCSMHIWPDLHACLLVLKPCMHSTQPCNTALPKPIKVVGMGSCGVDYLASVAAYPQPDQKLRTETLEVGALFHTYLPGQKQKDHPLESDQTIVETGRGQAPSTPDTPFTPLHSPVAGSRWGQRCQCPHCRCQAWPLPDYCDKGISLSDKSLLHPAISYVLFVPFLERRLVMMLSGTGSSREH